MVSTRIIVGTTVVYIDKNNEKIITKNVDTAININDVIMVNTDAVEINPKKWRQFPVWSKNKVKCTVIIPTTEILEPSVKKKVIITEAAQYSNIFVEDKETPNTSEEEIKGTGFSKWMEECEEEPNSVKYLKSYNLVKTPVGRKHIQKTLWHILPAYTHFGSGYLKLRKIIWGMRKDIKLFGYYP